MSMMYTKAKTAWKSLNLLIIEQQESNANAKICYICKETFKNKYVKDEKYRKVRDHCHYMGKYRGVVHGICNLKYNVPEKFL